jgi:hypothetical protein
MSDSNLTKFIQCKDPKDDKSLMDEKIISKNNCIKTGEMALTEISGSKIEPLLKEAIKTSMSRIKSEIMVLNAFKDPALTNPNQIVEKYAVPQRLVAEQEKKLWNEIKVESQKLDGTFVPSKNTDYDWIFSFVLGVVILFSLHYLNNREKIDEKVKYNTKNNKK